MPHLSRKQVTETILLRPRSSDDIQIRISSPFPWLELLLAHLLLTRRRPASSQLYARNGERLEHERKRSGSELLIACHIATRPGSDSQGDMKRSVSLIPPVNASSSYYDSLPVTRNGEFVKAVE